MTELIQFLNTKLIVLDITTKQSLVKKQDQLGPISGNEKGGLVMLDLMVFAGLKRICFSSVQMHFIVLPHIIGQIKEKHTRSFL